jgi:fructose transport system substrate-binding protein
MRGFVSSAARRRVPMAVVALVAGAAFTVAACGSNDSNSSGTSTAANAGGKRVKVALILKTFSNPYFVSMRQSAKDEASKLGVDLAVSAGSSDTDTGPQIRAINTAIAGGYAGVIITSNGDAVNSALQRARTAGLYTIALDTVPIPPSAVNLTYATDNKEAGRLIGKWAAAKLADKPATIAMLDAVNTAVISVDVDRDHGFLEGMGIPVGDPKINGKEPKSGRYAGGSYEIACQLPTNGTIPQGKAAMQTCLQKNPNINLVYAVNEPAAQGASKALAGAGRKAVVVAIDGGCANLQFVANGSISATAAQFPGKMAALGVRSIHDLATKRAQPATSPGRGFFDTGVKLFTNDAQSGVPSVDATQAKSSCWG